MRPSDITDGIRVRRPVAGERCIASMRPSDITDGIDRLVDRQARAHAGASMRPSDITDGIYERLARWCNEEMSLQ